MFHKVSKVRASCVMTGLKITAGQRTTTDQDDHLFGQTFRRPVILTLLVLGFQINEFKYHYVPPYFFPIITQVKCKKPHG